MKNFIEKVGNIEVYTKRNSENDFEVLFYNGTDRVVAETYFSISQKNAIADLFARKLDIYTEEWLWLNYITDGLVKLTDNTYKITDTDWFCRIDNTRYFKHFVKSESEFLRNKNGMRIIDR